MRSKERLRHVGEFVVRHRWRFIDATGILAGTGAVLYAGLIYDIFANAPGRAPGANVLELDELLVVIAVFGLGLIVAFRRLQRERRETGRRIEVERQMRTLAYQDALTGLPNRRHFQEALRAACLAPPAAGANHAVLMMDLNGFKRINDVYGHATGDAVLTAVGSRLMRLTRGDDVVARLGGDEFVMLARHLANPDAATGMALRIIEALEEGISVDSHRHRIGTAIGIALCPHDGNDPEEVLRLADVALYKAKEQKATGARSGISFFEPEMDAHIRERDMLERDLREAIENGQLAPHYQPLVDMRSGAIRGFEALARWTHPTLGDIPPTRFIAIAEDNGLIRPLTDLLFERACRDAAQWPSPIELAFNLSPHLFKDPGLPLKLLSTLASTGLAPHRLEIEITESAMVHNLEAAQATVQSLRAAGVRIALDDFGTGYSSLYHLRNFDVDRIKIDRSFVENMADDLGSAAIVRALIGLGTGLGLEITAEGVESAAQQRMLAESGCGIAQGFLYSEAVSPERALALLAPPRQEDLARTESQPTKGGNQAA